MRLTVNYANGKGLNKDAPAEQLAISELSDAMNIRFRDDRWERIGYNRKLFSNVGFTTTFGMPIRLGTSYIWALAGGAAIHALLGQTFANITRAAGPYNATAPWTGCVLNGIPIFTNGVDVPQAWQPPALGTPLINLPNWTVGEATPVIRAYYTVLVAIGLVQSGTSKPYTIKTSSIADPGALPSSWNSADPQSDALLVDLADTSDILVDGLPLRDNFIIYKEDSASALIPNTGGNVGSPFRVSVLFRETGLLAVNCVCGIMNQHFMLSRDDVVVHNGSAIALPGETRFRRWLFKNIEPGQYKKTFVSASPNGLEVWVGFVPLGETDPMLCAIWNVRQDKWSLMELSGQRWIAHATQNSVTSNQTWNTFPGTWEQALRPWSLPTANPAFNYHVGMVGEEMGLIDYPVPSSDEAVPSFLQREDFPFGQIGKDGQIFATHERIKMFRYIWPRIRAAQGLNISFQFGQRDDLSAPITWGMERTFVVGIDKKIDVFARARYLSYRIGCRTSTDWKIDGMDVDLDVLGHF